MKNIILLPLALILIISCQPVPKKKAPTVLTKPSTVYCKSSDDCKVVLTKLFREVYNPNGYQLEDVYGKSGPLYIITKELHNKIRTFRTATAYLVDREGEWLLSEIVDCRKKGDTCIISRY